MERIIALALLLAAVPAVAQPDPTPPAAVGEDLALGEAETRMTVPVRVAGAGPYPFVIDTGAERSVVSRQLAARLGLPPGRRVRLTAMAGSSEVETVVVSSLSVSSIGARRVEAPALEAQHLGAPGMLGIDTLQGHAVAIDFEAGRMSVVPAEDRTPRRGPDEIVVQARSKFGQLVVTDATVAGRKVRVVLDTGTSVSLGNLALKNLLAKQRQSFAPAVLTSVLGQQIVADYVSVPDLKLGDARITGLPVAFYDAAPFRAFGLAERPALFLGMDALRLFRRVHIDFANRELRLTLPRDVIRTGTGVHSRPGAIR